ncbi:MAG: acyl-CoA synthetase [Haloarculaceae archaeon]
MTGYDLRNLDADYEATREAFEWERPDTCNLAVEVCDRWADSRERMALYWEDEDGTAESYTFHELARWSNRFAGMLRERSVASGEFVAIYLPNYPEFLVALLGTLKAGAVAMPLYHLFGPDGLEYRLADADPSLVVTDGEGVETLARVDAAAVPDDVVVVRGQHDEGLDFDALLAAQSPDFEAVRTDPADPAVLFYTSGTTGDPKGVVQAHRYAIGQEVVGRYMRDFSPDDFLWHAGALAWAGGFANLVEAWTLGMPVLKYRGKFDPERTLSLLSAYDVTIFATAPTALRQLMNVGRETLDAHDVSLRVVSAGGERVTPDLLRWAEETFDAFATLGYGQTECYGVGWPPLGADREAKLGALGKPLPGFEAAVLDDEGERLPPGEVGELAIGRTDNPTMFLEYFRNPEETAAVTEGGGRWHRTGDAAVRDEDGYLHFRGREDDVVISAGYRISPAEIEATLSRHPAVGEAAAVGVPDEERTNVVWAYVEPTAGAEPSEALADDVREYVKSELAKFQYPREVRFVEDLPTTITGKIKRDALRERAIDSHDGG